MNRVALALVVAALSSLTAVGCSAPVGQQEGNGQSGLAGGLGSATGSGANGGGANGGGGSPCQGQGIKLMTGCNAGQGTYVAASDEAEKNRIGQEMWNTLTGAPCWYRTGSTQQYVFYGNLQYTFWGAVADSKTGGTLDVQSVGRYESRNAAILNLRGEQWIIATEDADPSTFYMAKATNGQPYIAPHKAHMARSSP